MKYLRAAFEDFLQAEIIADGQIRMGAITAPPARYLRAYDEDAYNEHYTEWRVNVWLDDRLARLEGLRSLQNNAARLEAIEDAARAEQLVPFIGSGMSAPSGLPCWSALLRQLATQATCDPRMVEEFIASGDFGQAATLIQESMPPGLFDEQVEARLSLRRGAVVYGAVQLLPGLPSKLVITTNLDCVLEQVYKGEDREFKHVHCGLGLVDIEREVEEQTIAKIHGQWNKRSQRVISADEYDRFYAPDAPHRGNLELLFRRHSLLFLGCSLLNDRTMQLLGEMVRSEPEQPRHYALLRQPEEEGERLRREHFLAARRIFPVWYDGDHDECIEATLAGVLHEIGRL